MFKLEMVAVFYGKTKVDIIDSITDLREISEMPTPEEVGQMLHARAFWSGEHIAKEMRIEQTPAQMIGTFQIHERITAAMNGIIVSWKKEN